MRIAQICPFFLPIKGGMENHVYEISKRLSIKNDVVVFTSNIDRKGKRLKFFEKLNKIEIRRMRVVFRISEFSSFFPSVFINVSKENFDIIHVHAYRHFHNFVPLFADVPAVITPHYPVYPFSSSKRRLLAKFFDITMGKKIFSLYSKIIALTEGEKIWLEENFHIPDDKIEVIPNGVPESFLKTHSSEKFRERFLIPEDKFLILSVGRIHYSKGFQDLLLAFSRLPPNVRKNIIIAIVGPDAGFKSELEKIVKRKKIEKNVIFTGEISEKLKLSAYEACDLFVLPSYWEGFGITIIEAMAKDKLVLARNTGGQKWIVPEKSFLFNSIAELSQKILHIYAGKLKKRLNYKEIVKENYTWDKIVKKLIKIYEEVVEKNT